MSRPLATNAKNAGNSGLIRPFYPDFYRCVCVAGIYRCLNISARFYLTQHVNYICRCSCNAPVFPSKCILVISFRLLHIVGTTLVLVALVCFAVLRVMNALFFAKLANDNLLVGSWALAVDFACFFCTLSVAWICTRASGISTIWCILVFSAGPAFFVCCTIVRIRFRLGWALLFWKESSSYIQAAHLLSHGRLHDVVSAAQSNSNIFFSTLFPSSFNIRISRYEVITMQRDLKSCVV